MTGLSIKNSQEFDSSQKGKGLEKKLPEKTKNLKELKAQINRCSNHHKSFELDPKNFH